MGRGHGQAAVPGALIVDGCTPRHLFLVPYEQDLLSVLAGHVVAQHAADLPDLSRMVILLPHMEQAARLRDRLADLAQARGHEALLGPRVDTLLSWMERTVPLDRLVLSHHARELTLVEALREHPGVLGSSSPWTLADSLLDLFDELTRHRVSIPEVPGDFAGRLRAGYGVQSEAAERVAAHLDQEAGLVHTLWTAWRGQLRADGVTDPETAHVQRLAAHLHANAHEAFQVYVAGVDVLRPAEAEWLRAHLARGTAAVFLHGTADADVDDYHPDAVVQRLLHQLNESESPAAAAAAPSSRTRLLNLVYASAGDDFAARAHHAAETHTNSPLSGIAVLGADHAEQEARAVEVQARRWILEGCNNIGIVTRNRRLARRIRALLERAGIALHDAAGWALSTTSAAAALERWLECVEQDFHYLPMLDLLKSPFVLTDRDRGTLLQTVYRFEQDLILHENIASGLKRYREHLQFRRGRLASAWPATLTGCAEEIVDGLEHAAAPLVPLASGYSHPPQQFLDALEQSLQRLGMARAFANDAAGERILQELARMRAALERRAMSMTWREFRTWLGRALERFRFRPATAGGCVQLLGLAESALCRFDAVVIAGADAGHLPGSLEHPPFFNEGVRRELGLPAMHRELTRRLYHFRRLLECAPRVLVSYHRERAGEALTPSPWVEALQRFHKLAFGDDLSERRLAALADHPQAQVQPPGRPPLPEARTYPAPRVDKSLLPESISATAYQELMDCPYQFFAARCLGLSAPEEIREMLEKSDYGERVHLCLQAFHGEVSGLPGPFAESLNEHSRERAVVLLTEISERVFATDLEDNFLHRGWLLRWKALIPRYVDWQIRREYNCHVRETEVRAERTIDDAIAIKGRLDRIDQCDAGHGVVDYKTGRPPEQRAVEAGEAVQLPFYAMLTSADIQWVEYLVLDHDRIKRGPRLEGPELRALTEGNRRRLQELLNRIQHGEPLPAWGDEQACARCDMQGLCRKQAWREETCAT